MCYINQDDYSYFPLKVCNHNKNNIRYFEARHVDIGYLLFSKEAFTATDLATSDKIRGLRPTVEVINSGTL